MRCAFLPRYPSKGQLSPAYIFGLSDVGQRRVILWNRRRSNFLYQPSAFDTHWKFPCRRHSVICDKIAHKVCTVFCFFVYRSYLIVENRIHLFDHEGKLSGRFLSWKASSVGLNKANNAVANAYNASQSRDKWNFSGQLILADLSAECPPTQEQRQWRRNVEVLISPPIQAKRGKFMIGYGPL